MSDSIKTIIKIVVYGIFGVSGILVVFGCSMIFAGSGINNQLMIDNGWSLTGLGIFCFFIALLGWVYVKTQK